MTVKRLRWGSHYRPVDDTPDAVLYEGELAIDDQSGAMKVGDGVTAFSDLDPLPVGAGAEPGSTINGGTP